MKSEKRGDALIFFPLYSERAYNIGLFHSRNRVALSDFTASIQHVSRLSGLWQILS